MWVRKDAEMGLNWVYKVGKESCHGLWTICAAKWQLLVEIDTMFFFLNAWIKSWGNFLQNYNGGSTCLGCALVQTSIVEGGIK